MDANQWLIAVLGFLAGGVLVGGGLFWWCGRQLKAAAARVDKVEKARQFAGQQVTQARKQVEALQKELGELKHASKAALKPAHAPAAAPTEPAAFDPFLPLAQGAAPPPAGSDGFADTLVLRPHKG
ncbi:hypothetical protein [Pelomonas sp. SE-A7]|uniref:hypothetical protein n=1 Tax=Pelomonas sp. SE-A7 TaxID=3054953 RepID=UPI00259C8C36|nr:hypothetical protein [Pelomonas sp. SE-A7]MDM4766059.1 hypothetical protein [Pelomonas sp. SE-A7]